MQSKMLQMVVLAFVAIGLTACATGAQRQMMAISGTAQEAGNELKECVTANYNDPKYASITPYLPSPENNFKPTMAQLAEEKVPTANEAKLLIQYHDSGLPCREAFLTKLGNVAPYLAGTMAEEAVKTDAVLMKLAKRKVSWGAGMKQFQQVVIAGEKKISQAAQQMDANFQTSHQVELAQRQAASNALMQWSLQQQMINAATQPQPRQMRTIDCDRFGNGFSCTEW